MNKKVLIIVTVAIVVLICAFFVLKNFLPSLQQSEQEQDSETLTVENATLEEIENTLDAALDARLAELE